MKRFLFLIFSFLLLSGGIVMGQNKPPILNYPGSLAQPAGATPPPPGPPGATPPPPTSAPPPPGPPSPPPPPPHTFPSTILPPLSNAALAVNTVQKAMPYLLPGKVWTRLGPRGEAEIKAAVIYEGVAVMVLHFNPENGSILPIGAHPKVFQVAPGIIEQIKSQLPQLIKKLRVLDAAEYREPERAWAIPIAYENLIVGHLKVYEDGIHLIPDYPATQEMRMY